MKIVAATNNAGKLDEIRRILSPMGHEVVSAREVGVLDEAVEDGDTFSANALKKAVHVCGACKLPTLADDSGLEVDALGGAPGVHSARYAGEGHDDKANLAKLLQVMESVPYARRGAKFVSVIAFVMPDGSAFETRGETEGVIGFVPVGGNGFGYDPVFEVDGVSFASMTDEQKDALSHRGKALRAFAAQLDGFLETGRVDEKPAL